MHMQLSRLDHCFPCHPSASFPFPLRIFWRLIRPTPFQWENFTETTPHHISTNRQNAALLCSMLWVAPPLDSLGKNHSNEKLEELGKRVSNRKDLRGAQCKRSFVVLQSSSDSLWILTFQIKASFCAFNNLRQVLPCKRNICVHMCAYTYMCSSSATPPRREEISDMPQNHLCIITFTYRHHALDTGGGDHDHGRGGGGRRVAKNLQHTQQCWAAQQHEAGTAHCLR